MRSLRRSAAHAGFTLIELVVTMALAIVFLVVAVPSMQDFMASQQVAATATSLQTAAMQARSRAMQDNRRGMVQPVARQGARWAVRQLLQSTGLGRRLAGVC